MRRHKKPMKYYLGIFLLTALVVLGYSLYMILSGKADPAQLISLWFMPLVFTGVYYFGDVILDKMGSKKRKKGVQEEEFAGAISEIMRQSNLFLIEDFRRLQLNHKFQENLKIAYQIYINGETEQWTLAKLEKKFRPETSEAKAMEIVVKYVREQRDSLANK